MTDIFVGCRKLEFWVPGFFPRKKRKKNEMGKTVALTAATKRRMLSALRDNKKEPPAVVRHRPAASGPPKKKAKRPDSGASRGRKRKREHSSSSDEDDESNSDSSESSSDSDEEEAPPPVSTNQDVRDSVQIDWPATVLLIGKRFCGKTNAILNMINKDDFDNVWVITTTKHKNNLNDLVIDDGDGDPLDQVLESLSENFLEDLIDHQKETDAKTLLIFDDFIGIKGIKLRHSPNMKLLASSGRNFNVSIVFSSQDAVEISKTFRRNPEYVMIGDNDEDAVDLMAKTMASVTIPKVTMRERIANTCRKDYHFLFIDRRKKNSHQVKFPLVKE